MLNDLVAYRTEEILDLGKARKGSTKEEEGGYSNKATEELQQLDAPSWTTVLNVVSICHVYYSDTETAV